MITRGRSGKGEGRTRSRTRQCVAEEAPAAEPLSGVHGLVHPSTRQPWTQQGHRSTTTISLRLVRMLITKSEILRDRDLSRRRRRRRFGRGRHSGLCRLTSLAAAPCGQGESSRASGTARSPFGKRKRSVCCAGAGREHRIWSCTGATDTTDGRRRQSRDKVCESTQCHIEVLTCVL